MLAEDNSSDDEGNVLFEKQKEKKDGDDCTDNCLNYGIPGDQKSEPKQSFDALPDYCDDSSGESSDGDYDGDYSGDYGDDD